MKSSGTNVTGTSDVSKQTPYKRLVTLSFLCNLNQSQIDKPNKLSQDEICQMVPVTTVVESMLEGVPLKRREKEREARGKWKHVIFISDF